jgi:hypothetical protein
MNVYVCIYTYLFIHIQIHNVPILLLHVTDDELIGMI